MDEQLERVLIGDPNRRRVELLLQVFDEEFDVETATSQHFDEVKKTGDQFILERHSHRYQSSPYVQNGG